MDRTLRRHRDVVVVLDVPFVAPAHGESPGVGRPADRGTAGRVVAALVGACVAEPVAVEFLPVRGDLHGVTTPLRPHVEIVVHDERFPPLVGRRDVGSLARECIPYHAAVRDDVALEAPLAGIELDLPELIRELEVIEGQLRADVGRVVRDRHGGRQTVVVEEFTPGGRGGIHQDELVALPQLVPVPEASAVVEPVGSDPVSRDHGCRMPVQEALGTIVVHVLR